MKKFNGILMIILAVIFIGLVFVKAETIVDERNIEGIVYGENGSTVDRYINEWCSMYRSDIEFDKFDEENEIFIANGVIDIQYFEETYGILCTFENMEKVLTDNYDISVFKITKVGYYDIYSVYKMEVESETKPLGNVNQDEKIIDYYKICVYFMMYYNE